MATIQGTTPTFTLVLESETIDLTACENVYATFKQGGTIITKTGDEIDVSAQSVGVYLSQADTLSFSNGVVFVQLNWTYADGSRGASKKASVDWDSNLLKEVLK